MSDLLTISSCARDAEVGEKTIRLWLKEGLIPFKRLPMMRKNVIRIESKHWKEFKDSIKTVIIVNEKL